MTVAVFFPISNFFILPFWFLMIVLPHWHWTRRIIQSPLIAVAPALVYTFLVIPRLLQLWPILISPDISVLAAQLGTPVGALIAWAHFQAFDLIGGRWAYLDSRERRIPAWFMVPILFLMLMFGPIGFLLYLCVQIFYPLQQPQSATVTST